MLCRYSYKTYSYIKFSSLFTLTQAQSNFNNTVNCTIHNYIFCVKWMDTCELFVRTLSNKYFLCFWINFRDTPVSGENSLLRNYNHMVTCGYYSCIRVCCIQPTTNKCMCMYVKKSNEYRQQICMHAPANQRQPQLVNCAV